MRQLPYGLSVHLSMPYQEAVAATRDALKAEGFGVLTEIDVKRTMKEKLGADFQPYVILGACNPSLAHEVAVAARERLERVLQGLERLAPAN